MIAIDDDNTVVSQAEWSRYILCKYVRYKYDLIDVCILLRLDIQFSLSYVALNCKQAS